MVKINKNMVEFNQKWSNLVNFSIDFDFFDILINLFDLLIDIKVIFLIFLSKIDQF